jgi:hypothetical protein
VIKARVVSVTVDYSNVGWIGREGRAAKTRPTICRGCRASSNTVILADFRHQVELGAPESRAKLGDQCPLRSATHELPNSHCALFLVGRRCHVFLFCFADREVFLVGFVFGIDDAERTAQLVGQRRLAEQTGFFEFVEVGE